MGVVAHPGGSTMTPTLTALDAERAVLGAMLLDPECVPGVLARMSPDAFAEQRHSYNFV